MPTSNSSSNITYVDLTGINSIDALLGQIRWANSTISYSFPFSNSDTYWSTSSVIGYNSEFSDGEPWNTAFTPLTNADQTAFSNALQQWAHVANVSFELVTESTQTVGDIRAAYSKDPDELTLAWAYLPSGSARAGDVWINEQGLLNFQDWNPGTLSFETLLHEIGHALGLKHPFADPEDPTAATLPSDLDNSMFTVMSYSYANLEGDEGNEFSYYPTTPMVLDIAAIQYIYGANEQYRSGNNTYTFDDATTYHETIWDAGGTDSLLYTGTNFTYIDLNPFGASFIGQPVYVQNNGENVGLSIPNVWIADGVTIENATTGQGDDFLIGNNSRNILDGGAGIDTVWVESPRDQATLKKISGGYTVTAKNNSDNRDTLINIERLEFDDVGIALDLEGHAGQVAKLLGAVFAPAAIANKEFVGIGLDLVDGGMSYEQLAELALHANGADTHDAIVTLLWSNLFGVSPSKIEKSPYIAMLDKGELSPGGLAVLAANTSLNTDNIDLVGLMQTGLAYS